MRNLLIQVFATAAMLMMASAAQAEIRYESPPMVSSAPAKALQDSREAARLFLAAQCQMYDALNSLSESSNPSIAAAEAKLKQAGRLFHKASELMSTQDVKLSVESSGEVDAANALLNGSGYASPTSFANALELLSKSSYEASATLESVSFKDGEPQNNVARMKKLVDVAQRSSAIFVAICTLMALAKA